jgi:hypothetical protein
MDSFELWWEKNKDLYGIVGVKKEVAKAIWIDAQNEVANRVSKIIKKHS